MIVPGGNLLNQAFSLIRKQTVGYLRALGEVSNSLGYKIASYAPRVDVTGSFQPIPRRVYQVYGLDMEKNYANFYTSNDVQDIQRAKKGDIIEFNGTRWFCQSEADWFPLDGWTGVMVVDIGPIPATPPAFTSGDWSLSVNEDDEIIALINSYPGETIDYIEARINNEGAWYTMVPFPVEFPASITLTNDTDTVEIRAVLNGARSLPNEKVLTP